MKAPAPGGVPIVVVPVARLDEKAAAGALVAGNGAAELPRVRRDLDDHSPGDRVEVEQRGSWLPATLIERNGDRWLVHYDERRGAAGDTLDELVEHERIRVPLRPVEDDPGVDDVDP